MNLVRNTAFLSRLYVNPAKLHQCPLFVGMIKVKLRLKMKFNDSVSRRNIFDSCHIATLSLSCVTVNYTCFFKVIFVLGKD